MQHHSATVCSKITQFLPQCSKKDHCLRVDVKFASIGYIFFDKQPKLDTCYEGVTLHVNMTPLTDAV